MSVSVPDDSAASSRQEKAAAPPAPARKQLQMIWPTERLKSPPAWPAPAGYDLRAYRESDEAGHAALMKAAGFTTWTEEKTREALPGCLPGGFFVVVHAASRRLVATAMARPSSIENHPGGGELGWVAGDPGHTGKGLGGFVCAAATRRFLEAGCVDIFLRTDDFRLAAIKTYLKLGYVPLLFAPDMAARWEIVFRLLGMCGAAALGCGLSTGEGACATPGK